MTECLDCDIQIDCVKYTEKATCVIEQNAVYSIMIHIITIICAVGIPFIFAWFASHWHSDVKFPHSNLTVDKQFY
jgi:hypothetical protein